MADRFVDSVGGSDTAPYESWGAAAATLLLAVDAAVDGEDIFISSAHTETPGGSQTYAFPGTTGSPTRLISTLVDTTTYTKATTIQVDNSAGTNDISMNGFFEIYGCSFKCGDDYFIGNAGDAFLYDDCLLETNRSSAAKFQVFSTSTAISAKFKKTDINFSASNSSMEFILSGVDFEWQGGILSLGGTMPDQLFAPAGRPSLVTIEGVDLSALNAPLFEVGNLAILAEVHHCELHTGFSLSTGSVSHRLTRLLMNGCDDTTGNKLYRMEYEDRYGGTKSNAATFRTTGGASDGTTPISWEITSSADASEFSEPTKTPPIPGIWVDTTGSTTFTFNCLWDSATDIQNDEAWIEAEFLEASADTGSGFVDDRPTNVLTAPGDQTTNAVAWTISPSMTNANEFELSITVTVNRVGPIILRACLGKPSTTIFFDPKGEKT